MCQAAGAAPAEGNSFLEGPMKRREGTKCTENRTEGSHPAHSLVIVLRHPEQISCEQGIPRRCGFLDPHFGHTQDQVGPLAAMFHGWRLSAPLDVFVRD